MIITIIGARPQFVKAAVLSKELKKLGADEIIIHTGQHYDYKMSEVFFTELGLRGANFNLNVGSGTHGQQTAEMISGIEKILLDNKAAISQVVVYGDTNSTIAGAFAASKLNLPIVHVEAGLRSYNRSMPEEINRVVTDHLSSTLFCSSETGRHNLAKEGITESVHVCGDIMLDAFQLYSDIAQSKMTTSDILPANVLPNYYLLTLHRPVNTDNKQKIVELLSGLASISANVVWPVHPRTRKMLNDVDVPGNVLLFEPFSYFEMMIVLANARKVLTDSGGLQKEAYWAKKPCITLRGETEWVETLHNNWNILSEINRNAITKAANITVNANTWTPLYGAGQAGKLMAEVIAR